MDGRRERIRSILRVKHYASLFHPDHAHRYVQSIEPGVFEYRGLVKVNRARTAVDPLPPTLHDNNLHGPTADEGDE